MATRSQLDFIEIYKYEKEPKPTKTVLRVYRHSDGYPDGECGVMADLKEFLNWNKRRADLEYCVANFILWSKLNAVHHHNELLKRMYLDKGEKLPDYDKIHTLESILKNTDDYNASFFLGFGVSPNDEFHGDIEYYYQVIIDRTKGEKNGHFVKPKITVKAFTAYNKKKPIDSFVFEYPKESVAV